MSSLLNGKIYCATETLEKEGVGGYFYKIVKIQLLEFSENQSIFCMVGAITEFNNSQDELIRKMSVDLEYKDFSHYKTFTGFYILDNDKLTVNVDTAMHRGNIFPANYIFKGRLEKHKLNITIISANNQSEIIGFNIINF